jgi:pSer/pThr/pTyr-binding forkhead associated (FHA) protein
MTKDNPVPANSEDHSELEPTTVGLPKLEPLQELPLGSEARSALEALPVGSALLVAHEGPNRGARFLLDQDRVTVGRHPDADIFLDDVTVSRQHAVFEREGNDFRMVDAGSLNGTYINHDRVDSIVLRTGMELQIGKFRLSYYAGTQQPEQ